MKKHLKVVIVAVMAFALILLSIMGMSTLGSNTAKAESITVHFKWSGDNPHLYFENVNGESDTSASYPGVPMKDEQNGWYSYTITNAKSASVQISVPSMSFQTAACERESGEWWFDEGTWYTSNPDSEGDTTSVSVAGKDTSNDKDNIVQVNYNEASSVNAEAGNITVHFVSDWSSANIYYWNSLPQNLEVEWPGKNMSKDSNGYFTYSFDSVKKINLLFSNGSEQTEDLTLDNAGEYWYKNGKWTNYDPANAPTPTPTVTNGPVTTPAPFARTDFRDESIYFVMTTRFYDGDSSNNAHCLDNSQAKNPDSDPEWRGDFKGLIEKLDYIKALGFSAIWITPVVQNDSGYDYHGYHAYNFKKVDPRYESSDCNYQDLINAAHKKGIKIVQDIVLNHTCNYGEENLTTANRDSIYYERINQICGTEYYHDRYHLGGGDWETYLVQTGIMANDCIDLETENPKVYNYLIDAYNQYIKMGVDAFRIDTVKHISRLTFNKTFLPAFKETGGDKFFMFGETCVLRNEVWNSGNPGISVPFYTWKETKEYAWGDTGTNEASVEKHFTDQNPDSQPTSDNAFLKGNDYHTPDRSQSSGMDQIDFYMHKGFLDANSAFGRAAEEDKYFNDATYNVLYVDSHDYAPENAPMDQRFNQPQDTWAENLSLMFTFRGIPCIYYGSEIEFMKGAPIDKGPTMPLSETGRAYFGDYIEGSVNTADYGVYSNATGTIKETLNYPLAKHIQRLNLIRRAVPALRKGQYSTEDIQGNNLAFKRRYTDSTIDSFVCVTISNGATFSGVPSGTYVDMVSGKSVQCSGTLKIDVSGKGNMGVYVLQTAGAPSGKIGEDGTYLK